MSNSIDFPYFIKYKWIYLYITVSLWRYFNPNLNVFFSLEMKLMAYPNLNPYYN